ACPEHQPPVLVRGRPEHGRVESSRHRAQPRIVAADEIEMMGEGVNRAYPRLVENGTTCIHTGVKSVQPQGDWDTKLGEQRGALSRESQPVNVNDVRPHTTYSIRERPVVNRHGSGMRRLRRQLAPNFDMRAPAHHATDFAFD